MTFKCFYKQKNGQEIPTIGLFSGLLWIHLRPLTVVACHQYNSHVQLFFSRYYYSFVILFNIIIKK